MRKSLALLAGTVMILSSPAYAEVVRKYYESGQLKTEAHFKDDKLDGTYKDYYQSGRIMFEAHFKDGETDGIAKMYYEGGGLMAELNYKDGKQDGISKGYYESGGIEDIVTYKNGQKTNQKHYDRKGKLEFEQDYPTE
jgi:antitoxin component YwqK of YwqJK toxin-antitoxin module